MAVECGAAINIENKQKLTPLTMAAYLARMEMFFHIASIEREIYWQVGCHRPDLFTSGIGEHCKPSKGDGGVGYLSWLPHWFDGLGP